MTVKNKKPALIVLAAGHSQVPVILKVKQLGYAVIAVDMNSDAPGLPLVDVAINCSTYEPDVILEYLAENCCSFEIKGIINRSSGYPVVTTAKLSRALRLPNLPGSNAEMVVNKNQLMEFCRHNNIPVPDGYSETDVEKLNSIDQDFPCIVKPALSLQGKRGVIRVDKQNQLKMAFANAKRSSINGVVNIDEYITGDDVILMSVVVGGILIPLALIDEHNGIAKDNRNEMTIGEHYGQGMSVPSKYQNTQVQKDIIALANSLIHHLKIERSPLNVCCRITATREVKLIEIHLDIGGDLILDHLIPNSTSFELLSFIVSAMAGDCIDVNNIIMQQVDYKPTAIEYLANEHNTGRNHVIHQASNQSQLVKIFNKEYMSSVYA